MPDDLHSRPNLTRRESALALVVGFLIAHISRRLGRRDERARAL